MDTCFVIQPFDGGKFEKRYEDVFALAIADAGLDPYRVDQDPQVSIPIDDIEDGIRNSLICFAEITSDNPNVWFELGFAIASGKEVVLVCSDERTTKFPFDVQHRTILRYATSSTRDFEKIKTEITLRIKGYIQKSKTLANVSEISKSTNFEGLDHYEVVALAAVAQNLEHPDDNASTYQIRRDMEASGFTKIATTIALKTLTQKGFLNFGQYSTDIDEYYSGYSLTDDGWNWIVAHRDQFVLKESRTVDDVSDIPF